MTDSKVNTKYNNTCVLKSLLKMQYFFNTFAADENADDIKPHIYILGVVIEESRGGSFQILLLAGVYRLFRKADILARTCFYLGNNQQISLGGDDIQLLAAAAPVPMQNNITFI